MDDFGNTFAYRRIKAFSRSIDTSIRNEEQKENENMKNFLAAIDGYVNKIDVINGDNRYGNKGFCNLIRKIEEGFCQLLEGFFLEKVSGDLSNILYKYFVSSFGNRDRIDFGTGHELNFLCFLYVLVEERVINLDECCFAIDLYSKMIRKIIMKYNLEAAGSHGVWGIDDYQIVPFLYGSSQLYNCDLMNVKENKPLMYAEALEFVKKHKSDTSKLDLSTHSPILFELSKKPWNEVNQEVFQMFDKYVLGNRGVNQHFIFSKYLPRSQFPNRNPGKVLNDILY